MLAWFMDENMLEVIHIRFAATWLILMVELNRYL